MMNFSDLTLMSTPKEMELKVENKNTQTASHLDLDLEINDGIFSSKLYDKLEVFWLVEISLVLDTNNAVASRRVSKVPSCSTASGVIVRMAHCCVVSDFTFVF